VDEDPYIKNAREDIGYDDDFTFVMESMPTYNLDDLVDNQESVTRTFPERLSDERKENARLAAERELYQSEPDPGIAIAARKRGEQYDNEIGPIYVRYLEATETKGLFEDGSLGAAKEWTAREADARAVMNRELHNLRMEFMPDDTYSLGSADTRRGPRKGKDKRKDRREGGRRRDRREETPKGMRPGKRKGKVIKQNNPDSAYAGPLNKDRRRGVLRPGRAKIFGQSPRHPTGFVKSGRRKFPGAMPPGEQHAPELVFLPRDVSNELAFRMTLGERVIDEHHAATMRYEMGVREDLDEMKMDGWLSFMAPTRPAGRVFADEPRVVETFPTERVVRDVAVDFIDIAGEAKSITKRVASERAFVEETSSASARRKASQEDFGTKVELINAEFRDRNLTRQAQPKLEKRLTNLGPATETEIKTTGDIIGKSGEVLTRRTTKTVPIEKGPGPKLSQADLIRRGEERHISAKPEDPI
jgi:hypothetical protein